ncbi:hypothetical protein MKW98_021241 [Papaver atlanticum]|uniref:Uncharacterized protein n=1 Tax=Papaver atlanticum TaxID=357466 RepID=A0AAD4XBS9_9MAGN|nr:hypothetical protein MKW98_021241 [Papaver atlanticum]
MREEKMKRQLEKTTQRLYVYVRSYQAQIQALNEQLSKPQSLLQAISSSSPNRFERFF